MKVRTAVILSILLAMSHFVNYANYYLVQQDWYSFGLVCVLILTVVCRIAIYINKCENGRLTLTLYKTLQDMHKEWCQQHIHSGNSVEMHLFYNLQKQNISNMRFYTFYK